ncbi:MAG: NRDE family protein [Pseudomonadota bacterium]
MCLILLSYKQHPVYPLVFAANRDEFYDRPSAPASFWEDRFDLLAGRDLKEGGTWLGITRGGRMAALTNYRDPASVKLQAPSRGWLVKDYLCSQEDTDGYLKKLGKQADRYNGFNVILGDPFRLYYFSNRNGTIELTPGLYGLSNALLNTPWPKVERGKQRFGSLLSQTDDPLPEDLLSILKDQTRPEDGLLPDTGVGLEWERILSSIFISSSVYGTRSSILLLVDRKRHATFIERIYNGGSEPWVTAKFEFIITGDARYVET